MWLVEELGQLVKEKVTDVEEFRRREADTLLWIGDSLSPELLHKGRRQAGAGPRATKGRRKGLYAGNHEFRVYRVKGQAARSRRWSGPWTSMAEAGDGHEGGDNDDTDDKESSDSDVECNL